MLKFKYTLFNVDIISNFFVHQNLDTIGWVSIEYTKRMMWIIILFLPMKIKLVIKCVYAKISILSYISSILSFNIECMSHVFESFPYCYLYDDFISIVSKIKEKYFLLI